MKTKAAGEKEAKVENGLTPSRNWRALSGVLLCLLGLSAAFHSARAGIYVQTNPAAITNSDSGQANLYPSGITVSNVTGKITQVVVALHGVTHSYVGDYDILLVGPHGERTILMSDCGNNSALNNVSLTFIEGSPPLPSDGTLPGGPHRPTDYGATDIFPPLQAQSFPSSLAVFNNTTPGGTWNLYVVDDSTQDSGIIANGWTLQLTVTEDHQPNDITVPGSGTAGVAGPYPSQVIVSGYLGNIRKVRVKLGGINHTYPGDMDILLVGPGGQNAIIMSDAGLAADISNVDLIFDDAAANSLPDANTITSGTFKPTNHPPADSFPASGVTPGGSELSVFNGTSPNGTWKLFVVDDTDQDTGLISDWGLEFDLEPSALANISTRLKVETGDNALIGGFIVTGTQPKKVILRAIGPSLNLPGQLEDPTMELRDGQGGLLWFNDDWEIGTQGFPSQEAEIIASTIPPTNEYEPAIVATLPANNSTYTAIVRGYQNSTGIALVEAYDLNRTVNSKLANISTRGLVQTGDNVLIAGLIVTGGPSQRVIVRAIGPSLNVPGNLVDPTLELRDGQGTLIAFNDDWADDERANVAATTVAPTDDLESAIVATLPSGGAFYTAIVRGFQNTTGVALVEVYGLGN